jgi:environmental stress-induced protein Ves
VTVRLLRAADRIAVPWKNGGGITREICRSPGAEGSGPFDWRISIAEVSESGPFSRFVSYRRLIALIAGRGMELHSASSHPIVLIPRTVHAFDGEDEVTGILPSGPVSDLNVIFRQHLIQASLRFSEGAERWDARSGTEVILINVQEETLSCIAGGETIQLAPLDAISAAAGASVSREPGGTCAVVQLDSLRRPS